MGSNLQQPSRTLAGRNDFFSAHFQVAGNGDKLLLAPAAHLQTRQSTMQRQERELRQLPVYRHTA
jgi:hypothetical protein